MRPASSLRQLPAHVLLVGRASLTGKRIAVGHFEKSFSVCCARGAPQAIFSSGRFIKARPNNRFIKASSVLSKQKQPNGQTSRFELRVANSMLARTISLSATGPSHFQRSAEAGPMAFFQGPCKLTKSGPMAVLSRPALDS